MIDYLVEGQSLMQSEIVIGFREELAQMGYQGSSCPQIQSHLLSKYLER